jgi:hypothetical protein
MNLIRGEQVLLQKSLQEGAAHLAGAQNGHADVGQLRGYFGGLNSDLCHVLPCFPSEWSCFHPEYAHREPGR